jgi:hypothetical protein
MTDYSQGIEPTYEQLEAQYQNQYGLMEEERIRNMTNKLTSDQLEAAAKCAEGYIKHYKGALIDLKQKHEEDCAMWLEGEYEADLNYIENGIENFETLLALANAELERQSVTDEDVAEAIQFLEIINHPQFALWDKKQRKALSLATEALQAYRLQRELYKIAKRPNPNDLTETAIAQLTYDIERINTLRGDEWDYEPGAEEMRKELSAKYGHAINALMDYNKTVTVTWIGDPDDCPSAICSRCDRDLTIYDWYDKLVFGPRQYCPFCGGRIGKQVREGYTDEDDWEEE